MIIPSVESSFSMLYYRDREISYDDAYELLPHEYLGKYTKHKFGVGLIEYRNPNNQMFVNIHIVTNENRMWFQYHKSNKAKTTIQLTHSNLTDPDCRIVVQSIVDNLEPDVYEVVLPNTDTMIISR